MGAAPWIAGGALLCLFAGAILWATGRASLPSITRLIVQAIVFVITVLALRRVPSLRRVYAEVPAVTRLVLVLCLCGCVIAQLLQTLQVSYPFIGWSMYGWAEPVEKAHAYEYAGVNSNGATVQISPSSMFPALRPGFFEWRLHKLLDNSLESREAERVLRVLAPGVDQVNIYRRTLIASSAARDPSGAKKLVHVIAVNSPQ